MDFLNWMSLKLTSNGNSKLSFTEDGGTVNMSKEQKVNQWKEDVKNQMSEILEFVTF